MEQFSGYTFEINSHEVPGWGDDVDKWVKGYFYLIYDKSGLVVESNEYFDSVIRARMAAIGHITLLEKGEGHVKTN